MYGPATQFYIRGVGQNDSTFAFEPGVGIYVDDVYNGILLASTFDLLDLDRVEVLRGPQGTLSGKNSLGGSVKLFSRKPDGDGGGFIEAPDSYTSYGTYANLGYTDPANFAGAPGAGTHTPFGLPTTSPIDVGGLAPNKGKIRAS